MMTFDEAIEALNNDNRDVRIYAVQTLGKLGDPRAIESLIPLLGDSDVQRHAVKTFGRLGSSAVPALVEALTDAPAKSKTLQLALQALQSIGESATSILKV